MPYGCDPLLSNTFGYILQMSGPVEYMKCIAAQLTFSQSSYHPQQMDQRYIMADYYPHLLYDAGCFCDRSNVMRKLKIRTNSLADLLRETHSAHLFPRQPWMPLFARPVFPSDFNVAPPRRVYNPQLSSSEHRTFS